MELFDWLLKIENHPHCRLGCKQYQRALSERSRENKVDGGEGYKEVI